MVVNYNDPEYLKYAIAQNEKWYNAAVKHYATAQHDLKVYSNWEMFPVLGIAFRPGVASALNRLNKWDDRKKLYSGNIGKLKAQLAILERAIGDNGGKPLTPVSDEAHIGYQAPNVLETVALPLAGVIALGVGVATIYMLKQKKSV